jgi:hypothetical protein
VTAADPKWRGYGPLNAGQVRAERAHADGQMRCARANAAKADRVTGEARNIERSAREHFQRQIASDGVATARACRRWARDLSHDRTGAPR